MQKRDAVPGLGEKLKASRIAVGLNQVQAGEASGVNRENISKFERDAKTPTLATLYKLAAAYGVTVCDLLPDNAAPAAEPAPAAKKRGRKK